MKLLLFFLLLGQLHGQTVSDCEEDWEYIAFLKSKILSPVESVLSRTFHEVKDNQDIAEIMETLTQNMFQVRQVLLDRIKGVRKEEILTCPSRKIGQENGLTILRKEIMKILLNLVQQDKDVKTISGQIFNFKTNVQREVMRILTIPQGIVDSSPKVNEDCSSKCETLAEINFKVGNIVACAKEKEEESAIPSELLEVLEETPITDIDIPDNNPPVTNPYQKRLGVFCEAPNMYFMTLIGVNEMIDAEIEQLYTKMLKTDDEAKEVEFLKRFEFMKNIRESVDQAIQHLSKETSEEGKKETVKRSLEIVSIKLDREVTKCVSKCLQGGCDSCEGKIYTETLEKIKDIKAIVEKLENEKDKNEFVRRETIVVITGQSEESRKLTIKEAESGKANDCDVDKSTAFVFLRDPLWTLVKSSLVKDAPPGQIEVFLMYIIDILRQEIKTKCEGSSSPTINTKGESEDCDREEFENTEDLREKVDNVIQNSLFKVKGDESRVEAILEFVDVQRLIEERVQALFENGMKCPDEVVTLKRFYMSKVQECRAGLMEMAGRFASSKRSERLSCAKDLRFIMERRSEEILRNQLENNFSNEQRDPDIFGSGDSPLSDIDLPGLNSPVLRPTG